MTTASDAPPAFRAPPRPLQPFHLKDVRLTARTAFYAAQQTNLAWLKQLEPDRMLYFFRSWRSCRSRRRRCSPTADGRARAALRGELSGTGCRPSPRPPRAAPSPSSDRGPSTSSRRSVSARTRCRVTSARFPERVCATELLPQGAVGAALRDAQAARRSARGTLAPRATARADGGAEALRAFARTRREDARLWRRAALEEFINQEVGGERGADPARRCHERPFVVSLRSGSSDPASSVRSRLWAPRPSAVRRKRSRRCTRIRTSPRPSVPPPATRRRASPRPRAAMSFFDELNASILCDGRLNVERRGGRAPARWPRRAAARRELLVTRPPRDVRESQLDAHLALDHGVGRRRRRGPRGGKGALSCGVL